MISFNIKRTLATICFLAIALPSRAAENDSKELIYVDPTGVMRWRTTNAEVAMFGANYCLPSATDYRAAGAVNADRKKLIDQDMTHFSRMGWDVVRLCFYGDWECSDKEGNLIANEHLDLFDYLIFRAKERDLHMLLSPIVNYSSLWPDGKDDSAPGFGHAYSREEMGKNPKAIAAQANYLKQLLNHVNPYTKLALKDEPAICFVELINEPAQSPHDFEGSVNYINTLVNAVRETGCRKVTFFNFSQDFAMAQALAASKIDGVSFAWYPSGLVSGHELQGNFVRTAEDFSPMLAPEVANRPRLVYEFDMPDTLNGYCYPAMVRTFRSVGAQSATMFSYDMLATAPYNLGWQTHCLNMVYTPKKAASAIIASQVMRRIPRMQPVGTYPTNLRFGDFRVSYDEDLSELVSTELFYYSNNTRSRPPAPEKLQDIVGFGSSPIVNYEGSGLYFLNKIENGVWRLEVYPDALQIDNPYGRPRADRPVFRLISRTWPMSLDLPDLGAAFKIEPLNTGNTYSTNATGTKFSIRPGVYLLTSASHSSALKLPERLPGLPCVLGMREFVCPEAAPAATSVVLHANSEYPADEPLTISVTVAATTEPKEVRLNFTAADVPAKSLPMQRTRGYEYSARLPAGAFPAGEVRFTVNVIEGDKETVFPKESPIASTRADTYRTVIAAPHSPVSIFTPGRDVKNLSISRSGEARNNIPPLIAGSEPGREAFPFGFPRAMDEDFTASLYIGDFVSPRATTIAQAQSLHIKLKSISGPSVMRITMVEKDGAAWSTKVFASPEWKEVVVPIASLRSSSSVMLPEAFPGTWSYWLASPAGRKSIDVAQVERLQFSMRKVDFGTISSIEPSLSTVAIESVSLQY